jgi:alpha-methylacyl-CoA racemase
MLLGDMGADVLRIDRVVSDSGIELDEKLDLRGRNKRSARINLKHPKGRSAFMQLV